MGEVVRFVPKPELERARLIREARAIYESIFPTEKGPASQNVSGYLTPAITPKTPVHYVFLHRPNRWQLCTGPKKKRGTEAPPPPKHGRAPTIGVGDMDGDRAGRAL